MEEGKLELTCGRCGEKLTEPALKLPSTGWLCGRCFDELSEEGEKRETVDADDDRRP